MHPKSFVKTFCEVCNAHQMLYKSKLVNAVLENIYSSIYESHLRDIFCIESKVDT